MARASAAIEVFAHFCEAAGLDADEVDAVATSAIREATNSEDFLRARARGAAASRSACSRARRRRATATSRRSTRPTLRDGAVLDLGGGSMQLVRVARPARGRRCDSWRLGAVRMTERFLPGDGPASAKQLGAPARARRAQARARRRGSATRERASSASAARSATSRRRCSARSACPSSASRATAIERAALDDLVERLAGADRRRAPRASRASSPRAATSSSPARSSSSRCSRPAASTAIEATEAGPARGRSSSSARSPAGAEPLFDDVRRASVLNLAAQYDPHAAHTRHVARPRAAACSTSSPPRACTPATPPSASCCGPPRMLHDIGVAVDYDDHHKHSRYLILSAGLPGLQPARGRADRPDRPLPPQGHARPRARSPR